MATNDESPFLHFENADELRHAERLNQIIFITTIVAAGGLVGTIIALVLYITLGSTLAIATGTILGGVLGGLIGVILARINKRKRDAELWEIVRGWKNDEPSGEL